VLLLVLAIPGLIAEVGFGRYAGQGVIGAFRKVVTSRGMVGLGVVVLVVNVALMSYLEGRRELLASDEA
jgi:NSS family neurotransmitter:Na+ symporter